MVMCVRDPSPAATAEPDPEMRWTPVEIVVLKSMASAPAESIVSEAAATIANGSICPVGRAPVGALGEPEEQPAASTATRESASTDRWRYGREVVMDGG